MKKLIPFTLERWQQGNCTVKTADGREVKDLVYQPSDKQDYPLCGLINGYRHTWKIDGFFNCNPKGVYTIMLEVDCEVVYVSILRGGGGNCYAEVRTLEHSYITHPNFIKEIKVEL
jgi:hypothetical protein